MSQEARFSTRIVAAILVLLMTYSVLPSLADHEWKRVAHFGGSSSMNTDVYIHFESDQNSSSSSSDGESSAQNTPSSEYMLLGIWGAITTGLIAYDTRRCKNPRWLWWIIGNLFAYPILPFIYLWTRREAAKSFVNSLLSRGKKTAHPQPQ